MQEIAKGDYNVISVKDGHAQDNCWNYMVNVSIVVGEGGHLGGQNDGHGFGQAHYSKHNDSP